MGADSHKLVDRGQTADRGPILDGHMAAHLNAVGDDHMIADAGIVRHVRVSHQQAVAPNLRRARSARPPIEGGEFANRRAIAHDENRVFALELQVLRIGAQNRALGDKALTADPCVSLDIHVRPDDRLRFDRHVRTDYRVGADVYPLPQLRPRIDDCRRVNLGRSIRRLPFDGRRTHLSTT